MRWLLAWLLYGFGHAIHVVFDRWLPWGMSWPVYQLYSGCMTASSDIQGDGRGPWEPFAA